MSNEIIELVSEIESLNSKLDNKIEIGINKTELSNIQVQGLSVGSLGNIEEILSNASPLKDGIMSKEDKAKIDLLFSSGEGSEFYTKTEIDERLDAIGSNPDDSHLPDPQVPYDETMFLDCSGEYSKITPERIGAITEQNMMDILGGIIREPVTSSIVSSDINKMSAFSVGKSVLNDPVIKNRFGIVDASGYNRSWISSYEFLTPLITGQVYSLMGDNIQPMLSMIKEGTGSMIYTNPESHKMLFGTALNGVQQWSNVLLSGDLDPNWVLQTSDGKSHMYFTEVNFSDIVRSENKLNDSTYNPQTMVLSVSSVSPSTTVNNLTFYSIRVHVMENGVPLGAATMPLTVRRKDGLAITYGYEFPYFVSDSTDPSRFGFVTYEQRGTIQNRGNIKINSRSSLEYLGYTENGVSVPRTQLKTIGTIPDDYKPLGEVGSSLGSDGVLPFVESANGFWTAMYAESQIHDCITFNGSGDDGRSLERVRTSSNMLKTPLTSSNAISALSDAFAAVTASLTNVLGKIRVGVGLFGRLFCDKLKVQSMSSTGVTGANDNITCHLSLCLPENGLDGLGNTLAPFSRGILIMKDGYTQGIYKPAPAGTPNKRIIGCTTSNSDMVIGHPKTNGLIPDAGVTVSSSYPKFSRHVEVAISGVVSIICDPPSNINAGDLVKISSITPGVVTNADENTPDDQIIGVAVKGWVNSSTNGPYNYVVDILLKLN